MKNKKAQFYFLAVIVLAAVFIGIVTIKNQADSPHQTGLAPDKNELNTEISSVMDYLSNNHSENRDTILTNFSNSYINKIGDNKDIFFIFGGGTNLTLVGNKLNETSLFIDYGSGNQEVTNNGTFQNSYTLSGSTVNLTLDGVVHGFTFYEGENFYYLIKYIYNNQTFVIDG